MGNQFQKASIEKRLLATFIDYCILAFPLSSIFVWWYSFRYFQIPAHSTAHVFFIVVLVLLVSLCFRDIFGGASLGKRTVGLVVISNKPENEQTLPIGKRLLRNLPGIFWPIELIALVSSKDQRKIGDRITQTDVYIAPKRVRPIVAIIVAILSIGTFIGVMIVNVLAFYV